MYKYIVHAVELLSTISMGLSRFTHCFGLKYFHFTMYVLSGCIGHRRDSFFIFPLLFLSSKTDTIYTGYMRMKTIKLRGKEENQSTNMRFRFVFTSNWQWSTYIYKCRPGSVLQTKTISVLIFECNKYKITKCNLKCVWYVQWSDQRLALFYR